MYLRLCNCQSRWEPVECRWQLVVLRLELRGRPDDDDGDLRVRVFTYVFTGSSLWISIANIDNICYDYKRTYNNSAKKYEITLFQLPLKDC